MSTVPPDPEFDRLHQVLEQHGIEVILDLPPVYGSYGVFDRRSRQLWINPVVFELGIARPTIVHEAVHAAQYCAHPDSEELEPLGLKIDPPAIVQPYFFRYQNLHRRQVEAEAYAVQTQSDGVEQVINLIQEYCQITELSIPAQ